MTKTLAHRCISAWLRGALLALALVASTILVPSPAQAATTTTISWTTFIPQKRIKVSGKVGPVCKYRGSRYEYNGNGHGFDWRASGYKTATHAVIDWGNRTVRTSTAVSGTTVYRAGTNRVVERRQASKREMVSKVLGWGKGRVDLRMVHSAGNPFCSRFAAGKIGGAATLNIWRDGRWAIRSGTHRRMPNHMIYAYHGGKVTYLYKRKYYSPLCLSGNVVCRNADMTGLVGRYAR